MVLFVPYRYIESDLFRGYLGILKGRRCCSLNGLSLQASILKDKEE